MVEFISYDGDFPNLCSGTLILRIDGEEVVFRKHSLRSGGNWWFDGDYNEHIEYGSWWVDVPDEYKQYSEEIFEVVNDNVPWGCCGGCI